MEHADSRHDEITSVFFSENDRICKIYRGVFETETSGDSIEAGIDELHERWGFYLAYKAMAGEIYKLDEVIKKSVYEVFQWLACASDERAYERRMAEIYKQKQK